MIVRFLSTNIKRLDFKVFKFACTLIKFSVTIHFQLIHTQLLVFTRLFLVFLIIFNNNAG